MAEVMGDDSERQVVAQLLRSTAIRDIMESEEASSGYQCQKTVKARGVSEEKTSMSLQEKLGSLMLSAAFLAGCVEDQGKAPGAGLSGTPAQFDSMVGPCVSQASRLTGVNMGSVVVTDRIQTGGGPILTLSAADTPYTCRLETDGSVTVFSEFAN